MRKPVLPFANNKGADQPAHPRSLISTFVVRCLDGRIPVLAKSKFSRLELVCVAEAGLSLTWPQTPKTDFLVTRLICLQQALLLHISMYSSREVAAGLRRGIKRNSPPMGHKFVPKVPCKCLIITCNFL